MDEVIEVLRDKELVIAVRNAVGIRMADSRVHEVIASVGKVRSIGQNPDRAAHIHEILINLSRG